MRFLKNTKGYATQANAIKKLKSVVGDDLSNIRYLIAVTENGRFVPTVFGMADQEKFTMMLGALCRSGIAIIKN
ncbi:hypothetical protein CMK18_23975 [Candidatus Poribacteria bacterium]|mgnify:CR=1 FL=1|nr:hypothetical protein [Candidatus Poribacteria bacterium]|tara:strand:+ start:208 stop:429 length:222 start_codon:yes stop_codon:yes gene_type:complete